MRGWFIRLLIVKRSAMKFPQHKKHIRMLTDGTSDTVNLMQGSASKDTTPDIQQITPLIRELFQKEEVIALILFGSAARGQMRSTSDIDLCIVTPKNMPASDRWELLSYGSRGIDVSLFWDLPITIRFRIIREGKVLFCRDDLALHRIKADTVREYLDVAPLIRKHCLHAMGVRL
jgi:predicted nucleotidyltransferase